MQPEFGNRLLFFYCLQTSTPLEIKKKKVKLKTIKMNDFEGSYTCQ